MSTAESRIDERDKLLTADEAKEFLRQYGLFSETGRPDAIIRCAPIWSRRIDGQIPRSVLEEIVNRPPPSIIAKVNVGLEKRPPCEFLSLSQARDQFPGSTFSGLAEACRRNLIDHRDLGPQFHETIRYWPNRLSLQQALSASNREITGLIRGDGKRGRVIPLKDPSGDPLEETGRIRGFFTVIEFGARFVAPSAREDFKQAVRRGEVTEFTQKPYGRGCTWLIAENDARELVSQQGFQQQYGPSPPPKDSEPPEVMSANMFITSYVKRRLDEFRDRLRQGAFPGFEGSGVGKSRRYSITSAKAEELVNRADFKERYGAPPASAPSPDPDNDPEINLSDFMGRYLERGLETFRKKVRDGEFPQFRKVDNGRIWYLIKQSDAVKLANDPDFKERYGCSDTTDPSPVPPSDPKPPSGDIPARDRYLLELERRRQKGRAIILKATQITSIAGKAIAEGRDPVDEVVRYLQL